MTTGVEFFEVKDPDAPVRGYLHRAPGSADLLILTHGAGANCQTPLLAALAESFCASGLSVLRCDLPFRQTRPYGPPHPGSAGRDQAGLRAAVVAMRRLCQGKVFLGGHSYGGRQASILADAEPNLVEGLLLLSYPLHPPKKPEVLRTRHFPTLHVLALFVQGTRDGFATIAEMQSAMTLIPSRTELVTIERAGHELMTPANRDELIPQVTSRFLAFAGTTAG